MRRHKSFGMLNIRRWQLPISPLMRLKSRAKRPTFFRRKARLCCAEPMQHSTWPTRFVWLMMLQKPKKRWDFPTLRSLKRRLDRRISGARWPSSTTKLIVTSRQVCLWLTTIMRSLSSTSPAMRPMLSQRSSTCIIKNTTRPWLMLPAC